MNGIGEGMGVGGGGGTDDRTRIGQKLGYVYFCTVEQLFSSYHTFNVYEISFICQMDDSCTQHTAKSNYSKSKIRSGSV